MFRNRNKLEATQIAERETISIPVYLIDPEPVMGTNSYRKIVHIQKGASEGMKELVKILVK